MDIYVDEFMDIYVEIKGTIWLQIDCLQLFCSILHTTVLLIMHRIHMAYSAMHIWPLHTCHFAHTIVMNIWSYCIHALGTHCIVIVNTSLHKFNTGSITLIND